MAPIPRFSLPTTRIGHNECGKAGTRILGDVTPRPALGDFGFNISQVSDLLTAAGIEQQNTRADTTFSGIYFEPFSGSIKSTNVVPADSESTPMIYASNPTSHHPHPRTHPLVPFKTDSELWPYPRPL
ncbi:hypothetical protein J3R82DRAFT_6645 [Butyriboletus roseoflavus]|nr:hypothetical protein J3R82DRAFT_6645 [Butyriboletus roseoflavus]